MRFQADELHELQNQIFYSLPWVLENDPRFVAVIEAIVTEKFPHREDVARFLDRLAEIRQSMERLEERQETFQVGQDALRQDVTELQQGQTELQQGQTELQQGQTELRGDVVAIRGDIAVMREDMAVIRGDVAGLRQGQNALQSGLDRVDNRLLVLGNRWGVQNEAAVRNALRGLLAGLGYVVENYEVFDAAGEVHGVPGPVEIDLVVRNGELWLVEIKGRVSGNDLFAFMRKTRFYQTQTGRSATRRIVIAPVIEEPAQARAAQEGIECYSAVDDLQI